MKYYHFETEDSDIIPEVDEDQMREVDRIAMEDFGLGILQMMENAGRNLAQLTMNLIGPPRKETVVILAGSGGNGGGGLCCARHLHNHGYPVKIFLSKDAEELIGAAKTQLNILMKSGIMPMSYENAEEEIPKAKIVIDALIGYSLISAPRGKIKELISLANIHAKQILSLDIPSGIHSSTGETFGEYIKADRTLSLALPKPGLQNNAAGELYLGDIGIPPEVYRPLRIKLDNLFKDNYWIKISRKKND